MAGSETVVVVTIWALLMAGIFFGGRAWWRRRSVRKTNPPGKGPERRQNP
jgi:hypothetical protein